MKCLRWLLTLLPLLASPLAGQVDTLRGVVARDTLKVGFTSSVPGCAYPGRFAFRGDSASTVLEHHVLCWDTAAGPPAPPPPPPAPPPSGSVLWFADWKSGVTTDNGKWTNTSGTGTTNLKVVPSSGLGFPTANVLQVNLPGNSVSRMLMVTGKWTAPPVGGTLYYRVYHRSTFPDNLPNGGYHPLQNGLNNLAWEFKTGVVANGRVSLQWWMDGSTAHYPWTHFDNDAGYLVNHTYRIEWAITRRTATTGRAEIRIFDEAVNKTVPAFTSADFHNMNVPPTGTLASDSARYTFDLYNADAAFGEINLGNNGPQLDGRTGNNYEYYGAFAVCTSWCGPYTTGG